MKCLIYLLFFTFQGRYIYALAKERRKGFHRKSYSEKKLFLPDWFYADYLCNFQPENPLKNLYHEYKKESNDR
jgi:hypothetical protein